MSLSFSPGMMGAKETPHCTPAALSRRSVSKRFSMGEANGSITRRTSRLRPSRKLTVSHAVARAALMGARGNSGVILSQIVRGISAEVATRGAPAPTKKCGGAAGAG